MSKTNASPKLRRCLLGSTALIGLVLIPTVAHAAADNWTGASSPDWFTAGNWDNGVPDGTGSVTIDTTTPNPTVIDGGAPTPSISAIYVGLHGDAGLTISGGAVVTDSSAVVGQYVFSNGTVDITGAGSEWKTTSISGLTVGDFGNGVVTVENGGLLDADLDAVIGVDFSAYSGTVTVTGAGSKFTDGGYLTVGEFGHGILNVDAGGVVASVGAGLGVNTGGVGEATVDGAGSELDLGTGVLLVSDGGDGSLTISNGGKVIDGQGRVGEMPAGIGTVTVTGPGSIWTNSSFLEIGETSAGSGSTPGGTLNVSNGGAISSKIFDVGVLVGSIGEATIDGASSTATVTQDVGVGYDGTGTLTISGGAHLSAATATVGTNTGAVGTVDVTGAGSRIDLTNDLDVGLYGTGTLTVEASGLVNAPGTFEVGEQAGSKGTVTVTGTGSQLNAGPNVFIGDRDKGTVNVDAGGYFHGTSHVNLGYNTGGNGTLNVDGNGSLAAIDSDFNIGEQGTGSLTVTNGGAAVSNEAATIGDQAGANGTAVVSGAGSSWSSTDLTIGKNGVGGLVVSDGGTVNVSDPVAIAEKAGSTGTLTIGSATATPAAAGTFNAATIQFGTGDGAIDFNHTSTGYTFASVVSGTGEINQQNGTTIITGNSSGFSGLTNVTGGKLVLNGSLTGSLVTVDSGTLGGNGTMASLIANTGSNVAPGNSIGTLNVLNNAMFNAGSTYDVEVNAGGSSDLVAVGNGASINGGTVAASVAPGHYGASTTYTIVTAGTDVGGTFTTATVDSPFLSASLSYDLKDVYLTLDRINATAFHDAGQTPNEQATGAGLDSGAVGNAAANALVALAAPAQAAGLDQLSGEIHASLKGALIDESRYVRDTVNDRLARSTGAEAGSALWTSAYGSFAEINGDGNAAELGASVGGVFIGAEGMVGNGLRVGVLGGYGRGVYDLGDRNSSATANSYDAGAYAGYQAGGLDLRFGADYALHQINADRSVAFGSYTDALQAGYNAQTGQLFGEIGYKIGSDMASIEPFGAAAYVRQSTDGFTENGGASTLTAAANTLSTTFTTLGVRGSTNVDLGTAKGTLKASIGWRHALGDLSPTSTASFAGGDLFTVSGAPIAADAAVVDAGLDLTAGQGVIVGASYSGVLSSGGFDNGAKAHADWSF